MDVTELTDIIEEEESIIDPESPSETLTKNALGRALEKLQSGDYNFTPAEEEAIRFALSDVGELYLYAGTSSGFDTESEDEAAEHHNRARKALEQAKQLGIK